MKEEEEEEEETETSVEEEGTEGVMRKKLTMEEWPEEERERKSARRNDFKRAERKEIELTDGQRRCPSSNPFSTKDMFVSYLINLHGQRRLERLT